MALKDHEETRRLFGVVAEALRSEIRQVAEGVAMTNQRLDRLEGDVETFRGETASQFQIVGAEFKAVRAEAKAFRDEVTGEFRAVRHEMASGLEAVRAEMVEGFRAVRAEANAFRDEVTGEFQAVRAEMAEGLEAVRADAKAFRAETSRNFADVQTQIAGTYSNLDRRVKAVESR